jgi:RNA polymerase sigma factor for flagellar operon FliA
MNPYSCKATPQDVSGSHFCGCRNAETRPDVRVVTRHQESNGAATSAADRERIISEHLWLVLSVARNIQRRLPRTVLIEDLCSAGVLGLIDAVDKFDPVKAHFHPYAQLRVRGAILDSLRSLDWSPRSLRRKGRVVEQATHALHAEHGRRPTEIEISERLNMDLASYEELLGKLKSLEIARLHPAQSANQGEEDAVLRIPARPEDDPLFRYLRVELQQQLADAICDLPERHRLVVVLYYWEEMSMKEIAPILGILESEVRQMRVSSMLQLRRKFQPQATRKASLRSDS